MFDVVGQKSDYKMTTMNDTYHDSYSLFPHLSILNRKKMKSRESQRRKSNKTIINVLISIKRHNN
jgi:hypothetical protein